MRYMQLKFSILYHLIFSFRRDFISIFLRRLVFLPKIKPSSKDLLQLSNENCWLYNESNEVISSTALLQICYLTAEVEILPKYFKFEPNFEL